MTTSTRRGRRPERLASKRDPRPVAVPHKKTFAPMEAKPVTELPLGQEWQYEPKWDGFRCLAFREGKSVTLMSKAGKPLTRYFPEVEAALLAIRAKQFVVDGELVIAEGDALSFDDLLQRIHPAASRITRLSQEHPATYILFDMLVNARGKPIADEPLSERRRALTSFVANVSPGTRIELSPATTDVTTVQRWFATVGSGLDGVIAKRMDMGYQSGLRTGMQKLKHTWTADCVVGGFRYASNSRLVGSLLLGLYNDDGKLDHVGFTSGISNSDRVALTRKLEKLIRAPGFTGKAPGGPSRRSSGRSGEWQPLAPKLVLEVGYDHFSGGRFRHGTTLVRWRPDKKPAQCTMDQLPGRGRSAVALLNRS